MGITAVARQKNLVGMSSKQKKSCGDVWILRFLQFLLTAEVIVVPMSRNFGWHSKLGAVILLFNYELFIDDTVDSSSIKYVP